jgi:hypothetical protein
MLRSSAFATPDLTVSDGRLSFGYFTSSMVQGRVRRNLHSFKRDKLTGGRRPHPHLHILPLSYVRPEALFPRSGHLLAHG